MDASAPRLDPALKEEMDRIKVEIDELNEKVQAFRDREKGNFVATYSQQAKVPPTKTALKMRRYLKGHFGKIYAVHWGPAESRSLVSASQDGKLIVWNAATTNKTAAIALRSSWVMTCAYAPSGQLVACGGLDNLCSVYKLAEVKDGERSRPYRELAGHDGYLSCCRFLDANQIVTTSGDSTAILWDIDSKTAIETFTGHTADVMSISVFDNHTFVTGAVDDTSRVWDLRTKYCVATFTGHESDINCVAAYPSNNVFGSASDDSTCRLWDLRAYREISKFQSDKIMCGMTSIDFSKSGRFLFAGYDDANGYVWDVRLGRVAQPLIGHEARISSLAVSADGRALATGSWDQLVKIWA